MNIPPTIFLPPPLSLYIHLPWCVKKCPYCDFNSYPKNSENSPGSTFAEIEQTYVAALLQDLRQELQQSSSEIKVGCEGESLACKRKLHSIFIGGGTPSLFSLQAIAQILTGVKEERGLVFERDMEITMEVNPGTIDEQYLTGLRALGVNRLSVGVQSFQDDKLQAIGRIHDAKTAKLALEAARAAGFLNINLDLMFGLPNQRVTDAMFDLQTAVYLAPTHISWYQLAIEEGSQFYRKLPQALPDMDVLWAIQKEGQEYLRQQGYLQYEVSAYSRGSRYQCQHNLNYWLFGDYLGIGAGAHGKITSTGSNGSTSNNELGVGAGIIKRKHKFAHPGKYLQGIEARKNRSFVAEEEVVSVAKLPFEFMLNALRLYRPIPLALFKARTGLGVSVIADRLRSAEKQGFVRMVDDCIITTDKGRNFLNDLLEIFV